MPASVAPYRLLDRFRSFIKFTGRAPTRASPLRAAWVNKYSPEPKKGTARIGAQLDIPHPIHSIAKGWHLAALTSAQSQKYLSPNSPTPAEPPALLVSHAQHSLEVLPQLLASTKGEILQYCQEACICGKWRNNGRHRVPKLFMQALFARTKNKCMSLSTKQA